MISFSRKVGPYSCLSNMAKASMTFNEEPFLCAEAAWQAQRCIDPNERSCFFGLSGSAAKRLGSVIQTRSDWEDKQYEVMIEVLTAKFTQHEDFLKVLLSTGDEEIVADTTGFHENTWGRCSCVRCMTAPAMNLLGKALMEVRNNIRTD